MYGHHDAVGLPGLILFFAGIAAFLVALLAARRRRAAVGAESLAQRRTISWAGIVVQGLGVALAGYGPVAVTRDPASAIAVGEALSVAVLMGGAVWLFDASSRAMGANWSLVARTRSDHALVRHGPFAYVRHPIYVAIFLVTIAMAVAYGHTANLIVALPVFALGTMMRVAHEERLLRAAFGADYDDYAHRVARFVPGLF